MMDIVGESGSEEGQERSSCLNSATVVRVPVKHANLGIRSHAMDMSTMVELTSFSTLGKIQPFLVTISTTAALVVDLHCHLSDKEVCGYLGGHWDINAHNLAITNAFPCRYAGKDKQAASLVELEIARAMEWKRTTLVGWYHSHPRSHASPSLRDVDSQLDYQIKMKGISDNGYTPCVGLICSPYNTDGNCYESNFNVFWSMPPPENRPHEYPRPMLLSYSLSQEHFLPQDALEEIKKCIDYYKSEGGIDFMATFNGNTTYLERLRSSLASKLPGRNQSNGSYWDVIREMICPGAEDPPPDPFISSATTSMKYSLMTDSLNQPSSLSANSLFLAPAKFKTDNSSNPSTSRDKDDGVAEVTPIYAMAAKDSSLGSKHRLQADPVPSFQSGELTVSVKNTKCEYEFPSSGDFSKISSLLGDSSSKFRPATGDFPLADISQVTKFSELSKLANFSTADLAKLSGFALNDFTKMSPYVCNIANLFGPPGKVSKEVDPGERKVDDFATAVAVRQSFKAPMSAEAGMDDFSMDHKKPLDLGEGPKRPTDYSSEDLTVSGVKSDFGAMLDMTTLHAKKQQQGECDSLNLSKDRQ